MRYANDDIDTGTMELMGFFGDPLINSEINSLVHNAANMGVDFSRPEVMHGFFSSLNEKIKNALGGKSITIDTGSGTAKVGEGEISYTQTKPETELVTIPQTGGVVDMLKNPVILGTIIGVPVLLLLLKSKRTGNQDYSE